MRMLGERNVCVCVCVCVHVWIQQFDALRQFQNVILLNGATTISFGSYQSEDFGVKRQIRNLLDSIFVLFLFAVGILSRDTE